MDAVVAITNDLEKRIAEAFCTFDHVGDKTIDIREVGTVLRFLGCAPTEQEINEVIQATEMEDSCGEIHLSHFLPHMVHVLMERKMEPAEPDTLLKAFRVLDVENRGYVTRDYLTKVMMEEGEPFTQEEIDEMMAVAVDPMTGHIPYEFYLNQLVVIWIIYSYFYLLCYKFIRFARLKKKPKIKHKPKDSIYTAAMHLQNERHKSSQRQPRLSRLE